MNENMSNPIPLYIQKVDDLLAKMPAASFKIIKYLSEMMVVGEIDACILFQLVFREKDRRDHARLANLSNKEKSSVDPNQQTFKEIV